MDISTSISTSTAASTATATARVTIRESDCVGKGTTNGVGSQVTFTDLSSNGFE